MGFSTLKNGLRTNFVGVEKLGCHESSAKAVFLSHDGECGIFLRPEFQRPAFGGRKTRKKLLHSWLSSSFADLVEG